MYWEGQRVTINQLRKAEPSAISEITGINLEKSNRLIESARLLCLPRVNYLSAVKMISIGLTIESILQTEPEKLLEQLHLFLSVTLNL